MIRLINFLLLALWAFFGLIGLTFGTPIQTGTPSIGHGMLAHTINPAPSCVVLVDQHAMTETVTSLVGTVTVSATTTEYLITDNIHHLSEPLEVPMDFFCDEYSYLVTGTIDCWGTWQSLPFAYHMVSDVAYRDCMYLEDASCFDPSLPAAPLQQIAHGIEDRKFAQGVLCQRYPDFHGTIPEGHKCWGNYNPTALFRYGQVSWDVFRMCMLDPITNGCTDNILKEAEAKSTWTPEPRFMDYGPATTAAPSPYVTTITQVATVTPTLASASAPPPPVPEAPAPPPVISLAPEVVPPIAPGGTESYTREFSCSGHNYDETAWTMWEADTQALFCTETRVPLVQSYHVEMYPKYAPNNGWDQACMTSGMAQSWWMLQQAKLICTSGSSKFTITLWPNPDSVTHRGGD